MRRHPPRVRDSARAGVHAALDAESDLAPPATAGVSPPADQVSLDGRLHIPAVGHLDTNHRRNGEHDREIYANGNRWASFPIVTRP